MQAQAYKPRIHPLDYIDKSALVGEYIVPMEKPDVLAQAGTIPDIGGAPEVEGDTYYPQGSYWEVWVLLALVVGIAVFFGGGR